MKKAFRILFSNFDIFLVFQLTYSFLCYILYCILQALLNISLKATNQYYFTHENLLKIVSNPISILSLFLILIAISIYFFIQYAGLTVYYNSRNKRLTLKGFFKEILKKFKLLKKITNLRFLSLIFLFSVLQYLLFNPSLFRIIIPEFIMEFIISKKLLYFFYLILIIFLFILFIKYSPALYFFFIKEEDYKKAMNTSKKLTKKVFINILKIIVYSLLVWALGFIIYLSVTLIVYLPFKFLIKDLTYFFIVFKRIQAVYRLVGPMILISMNLFLSYIIFIKDINIIKFKKKNMIIRYFLILLGFLLFLEFSDVNLYSVTDYSKISIVSHRAGGIFAPENTIAGIDEAIENGADYAEIDVQITKDGVLVLSHDETLKRTANIDKYIKDMTLEEIKKVDVGVVFSPKYAGEKIPTLDDILMHSKGKIKLIIELKGQNKELVSKTIESVKKYNMEEEIIIASLQFDLIKEVKEIDANIKTSYIVAFAYGDFLVIQDYVDIYAFEPSFIDEQLLHILKGIDKEIYIWTINKDKNIYNTINLPIDGIITDNPVWVRYVISNYEFDIGTQVLSEIFQ